MAKGSSKGSLTVLRSRSTGFILIGVMGFLIAGFVFQPVLSSIPNVLPQANPDEFEIPFVSPEQENSNEQVLQDIEEILTDPAENITLEPNLQQQYNTCQENILLASQPNSNIQITNQTLEQCTVIEQEVQDQTTEQVDTTIDNLQDQIIIPDQEQIPTESSEDPTLVQIGDIVDETQLVDAILPQSTALDLITRVTKIDSNGNREVVEKTTAFTKLAFLVEEQTNINYRNGFLEIGMYVKGEHQTKYTGTGTMDIKVGGTSIFSSPITISFDQVSDGQGIIPVNIVSPSGAQAGIYTFDFNANFNRFIDGSVTKIDVIISSLDAKKEGEDFSVNNVTVFTMDIARDDIQAIITNEQGVTSRVYPSDSRIILSTIASTSSPALTYTYRAITYDSIFYGNGRGCSQFSVISDVTYPAPTSGGTTYPVPAPSISGISVLDSQGNVLTSSSGGTGKVLDFSQLTRNQNYKLKVTSPNIVSTDLVYGKAQETKSYTCQQSATPNLSSVPTTTGNTSICGLYTVSYSYVINPNNPITLGAISCNIPK